MAEARELQKSIDKLIAKYDFEGMLSDKRHKELLSALDEIGKFLETPNVQIEYKELDVSGITKLVEDIKTSTASLEGSMKVAVEAMGDQIAKALSDNQYKPVRKWRVDLDRLNGDPEGAIQGGIFTAID